MKKNLIEQFASLQLSKEPIVIAALYKFIPLVDLECLQQPLKRLCIEHNIKGTLLLASEGINGTVSGSRSSIDRLLKMIRSYPNLEDISYKESYSSSQPFLRLKVRLKREIVTLGLQSVSPIKAVGHYVEPKDWNTLISNPDVLLIDTRNKYEVEMGTFENAIDPQTNSFREFPSFYETKLKNENKQRKIAMFCTGGIRCEKSTSFLLDKGFENVYQLKGGILNYLEKVPENESKWKGSCYVFDQRIALDHKLQKVNVEMCGGCRSAVYEDDKKSEYYERGVQCPKCVNKFDQKHINRVRQRQMQIELFEKKNLNSLI